MSTSPSLVFLLVSDSSNTMTQRAETHLKDRGHRVSTHLFLSEEAMIAAVAAVHPDVILCPYLTKRVPVAIYTSKTTPCLIIHPGVKGDRGMSSIDWAILDNESKWGVTIMQADRKMDAGHVYSTRTFATARPIGPRPCKSSMYRIECTNAAMACLDDAITIISTCAQPTPLDYTRASVLGRLRPSMGIDMRAVVWEMDGELIERIVRASDTQPGSPAIIADQPYRLYGAHMDTGDYGTIGTAPGTLIGHRHGAVLVRCGRNGAIWITHAKRVDSASAVKLPAMRCLPDALVKDLPAIREPDLEIDFGQWPNHTFQELFYWRRDAVCYLWFDCYNGAMSIDQCRRTKTALEHISGLAGVKVVVLMGGFNYFCNGIHLNMIEAADDPADESWANINAIDDLVLQLLTTSGQVTVSAMMGNAGAGGVMFALAADFVWTHSNTILLPTYLSMALYGSEYWTYSLPKRVSSETAQALVSTTEPVSAQRGRQLGLIDDILCDRGGKDFIDQVTARAELIARDAMLEERLAEKRRTMGGDLPGLLASHRSRELAQMAICFQSPTFHSLRRSFVTKSAILPCTKIATTPTAKQTAKDDAAVDELTGKIDIINLNVIEQ